MTDKDKLEKLINGYTGILKEIRGARDQDRLVQTAFIETICVSMLDIAKNDSK